MAGQNAIPIQRLGTGPVAITYLRAMGSLLGTAVLGTMVAHSGSDGRSTTFSLAARQALAMGIEQIFLGTFGVAIGIFIPTLLLKDERLRKRGEVAP